MKNLNIRILFLFICLPFVACGQTPKKLEIPRPKQDILQHHLNAPEAYGVVNDFENLFTKAQIAELDSLIHDFEKRTTIQIDIATLNEHQCDKADFDAYSLQLANAWGVGIKSKDNGVLIAISKQFRQMRIQNGKGIEMVFSNEQTKQIIDEYFIPKFKEDNYFEGTKNGLKQLMKELEKVYIANADCYQLYQDTETELWGYEQNGAIKIRAKYPMSYTEILCDMALVADTKEGWIGIDKNGKILLRPFVFDNGPDPVSDGLFRFTENGKMGFANLKGEKVIPAQFDFAEPFKNGYALYYNGGEKIYEDCKTRSQMIAEKGKLFEDIHWSWGGNITSAGFTDKHGQTQDAIAYTNNLIDFIAKNDTKTLSLLTTEKLYCYLCFSKTPESEPFVSNQTFYSKNFNTIFTKDLIQRLQRNEAKVTPGTSNYGDILVTYTVQRVNEMGKGHEGAQFGFWLKAENGVFKISGLEMVP